MALLGYAPVGFALLAVDGDILAFLGGAIVVGGAMIPDIDQRVPGISHRGPTHTVWFALAIGTLLGGAGAVIGQETGVFGTAVLGAFGFGIGVLTIGAHLLADALTPAGIRPFRPLSEAKYTLAITRADNAIANYLLLAIGLFAAGAALVGAQNLRTGAGVWRSLYLIRGSDCIP
jgi:inner membrane protein